MARVDSFIKIAGTIDGISFYKTQDGYLARLKGGVSGNRIKSDPLFARTRENNEEFALAARAGKLLRNSIRPIFSCSCDHLVTSRLLQTMIRISKLDQSNIRGKRNPGFGLMTDTGKSIMKSFDFNKNAVMESVLFAPFTVNTTTGVFTINKLVAAEDLLLPEGASHFSISGAVERIDFSKRTYDLKLTNVISSGINSTIEPVILKPTSMPSGTGFTIYLLKVEFFQMVNNEQYSLRDGLHNALTVVEIF